MAEPALRRLIDLTVASVVLVATAPLLAAASIAIRLDSPGPVLFRQTRVGRGRRPIETLKLRTMAAKSTNGPQITATRDPRITRIGKLLRKSKIDELPQLLNVLRGDMSIVGPRPEVPQYVDIYRPEWQRLFTVRPGLTDLASIAFRDEESLLARAKDHEQAYREVIMPLKLELALEGLDRSSLGYDLRIVARTLLAVLVGRDPRHRNVQLEAEQRIELLNRGIKQA